MLSQKRWGEQPPVPMVRNHWCIWWDEHPTGPVRVRYSWDRAAVGTGWISAPSAGGPHLSGDFIGPGRMLRYWTRHDAAKSLQPDMGHQTITNKKHSETAVTIIMEPVARVVSL